MCFVYLKTCDASGLHPGVPRVAPEIPREQRRSTVLPRRRRREQVERVVHLRTSVGSCTWGLCWSAGAGMGFSLASA